MRKGFTLIELLVFIAIFTLVVGSFIAILVSVINIQTQQVAISEVEQQGQFLTQQIQYYVQSARLVDMPVDTTEPVLTLRESTSSLDPTIIKWCSGVVYIAQGPNGTFSPLTSSKVTVSNISFERHYNLNSKSSALGTDSVSYTFTVGYGASTGSCNTYSYSRSITMTSNATGTNTNFPMLFSGTYPWLAASSSGGRIQNLVTAPNATGPGNIYLYSRSITMTSNATGTNTNFPMLFSGTYPWLVASSSGGRIQNLVTAPNGGKEPADLTFATSSANCGVSTLNFETESYTSSTGAIADWVNIPSISPGTTIYACYDNNGVTTDQSHPSSTWNSYYQLVYHMNQNPAGSAPQILDSTANANNGTTNGSMTSGQSVALAFAKGLQFNNGSQYVSFGTSTTINQGTVSAIIQPYSLAAGYQCILCSSAGSLPGVYQYGANILLNSYLAPRGGALATSSPYWVVVTYNGSTANAYINNQVIVVNGSALGGSFTQVGSDASNNYFSGIISEVHMSTKIESASWLTTEYNNQSSPSTFYTIGNEQQAHFGQEPADLTFATSSANCGSSTLNFETESYNPLTGSINDWVEVPSLSPGTVIYACYGNPAITTDQSHPSSTWNSNYVDVYHFASPKHALEGNDSVASPYNLSLMGTPLPTATSSGEIDGGAAFTGQSDTLGNTSYSQTISTYSASIWFNDNSSTNIAGNAVLFWFYGSGGEYCTLYEGTVYCYNGGLVTSGSISPNTRYYVTLTQNATNQYLYLNGSLVSTAASGGSANPSSLYVGGYNNAGSSISGMEDEFHVLNVALSPSWILTEYNNQNSPSTFYNLGSEAIGGNSTIQDPEVFQSSVTVQSLVPKIVALQKVKGENNGASVSSISTGYPTNNESGDLLIAVVANSGLVTSSISDTEGNSWTLLASTTYPAYSDKLALYGALNSIGGPNTTTVTFASGASYASVFLYEYRGASNISSFDQWTAQTQPATSTPSSGIVSPTSSAELLLGIDYNANTNEVPTPGTGYILETSSTANNTTQVFVEDQDQFISGSVSAGWQYSGTPNSTAMIATFK